MHNQENTNHEEMQFQFGTPREEIDEPLPLTGNTTASTTLSTKKLEMEEKDKERKEKRYFSAFALIVGCLFFLGFIYLIDVILSAKLNQEVSSMTNSIVEIIKTLLFTLSGYLFARKENGD